MKSTISDMFAECFSKMNRAGRLDEDIPKQTKIQLDVDSTNEIKRDVLEASALENNISLTYFDNDIQIVATGNDSDLVKFLIDSGYCCDLDDVKNKFGKLDISTFSDGGVV